MSNEPRILNEPSKANNSNTIDISAKKQNGDSDRASNGLHNCGDRIENGLEEPPSICNYIPKKKKAISGHHPNDNNGSSRVNSQKHLSFHHDDDDEDNSVDSSDSSNYVQALVAKEESKDTLPLVKQNLKKPEKVENLLLSVRLGPQNNDASSTSSCSCEDHSSIADRSDNNSHEDLDYDEDSITNSPPRSSTGSKMSTNERTQEASGSNRNSDSGNISLVASNPRAERKLHDSVLNQAENSSKTPSGSDDSDDEYPPAKSSSKIRSFINFSHHEKQVEKVQDPESKTGTDSEKKKSKDRSHKSHEHLLKYFFKDACYFQIKSINHENVEISKSMGVWSTLIPNEIRLNAAFRDHRNVILIFSVQQSGGFQGFARMTSESRPAIEPVPWVFPARSVNVPLGGVFKLEWLCTKELSFNETRDLFNSYNGNKPVKVARDGQQVEPQVGQQLCSMFPRDSKRKLLAAVSTMKRQVSQRKKLERRKDSFYPMPGVRMYGGERFDLRFTNSNDGDMRIPGTQGLEYSSHNNLPYTYNPRLFSRRQRAPDLGRHRFPPSDQCNPSGPYWTSPNYYEPPGGVDLEMRLGELPFAHMSYRQGPEALYGPPPGVEPFRYHPYQRSRR